MPSFTRVLAIAPSALIGVVLASPAFAQTSRRPAVRDYARELACGPAISLTGALPALRVVGGQDRGKTLFAPGEAVVVSGGTAQGVKTGQDYFVRRIVADRFVAPMAEGTLPQSVHTAGWLHIVEMGNDSAIATITQACDGVIAGDYLEAFALPALPSAGTAGEPDYANPGHVMLADDRRQMGGEGSLMVLDRGSDHGLHAGQALTIFRPTTSTGSGPVFRVGRATAVVIGAETSLIRIDSSTDAVNVGDRVAIHR